MYTSHPAANPYIDNRHFALSHLGFPAPIDLEPTTSQNGPFSSKLPRLRTGISEKSKRSQTIRNFHHSSPPSFWVSLSSKVISKHSDR